MEKAGLKPGPSSSGVHTQPQSYIVFREKGDRETGTQIVPVANLSAGCLSDSRVCVLNLWREWRRDRWLESYSGSRPARVTMEQLKKKREGDGEK